MQLCHLCQVIPPVVNYRTCHLGASPVQISTPSSSIYRNAGRPSKHANGIQVSMARSAGPKSWSCFMHAACACQRVTIYIGTGGISWWKQLAAFFTWAFKGPEARGVVWTWVKCQFQHVAKPALFNAWYLCCGKILQQIILSPLWINIFHTHTNLLLLLQFVKTQYVFHHNGVFALPMCCKQRCTENLYCRLSLQAACDGHFAFAR